MYRHTHTQLKDSFSWSWLLLFFYKLLLSAGILLFSEGVTYGYVAPCYYLHSNVARSKIIDCLSDHFCFGLVTYHFRLRLPNQPWLFPLYPATNMLRVAARAWSFWSSDLELAFRKCVWANLSNPSSSKPLRSRLYFGHFLGPHHIFAYVTYPIQATCNRLYLLFYRGSHPPTFEPS